MRFGLTWGGPLPASQARVSGAGMGSTTKPAVLAAAGVLAVRPRAALETQARGGAAAARAASRSSQHGPCAAAPRRRVEAGTRPSASRREAVQLRSTGCARISRASIVSSIRPYAGSVADGARRCTAPPARPHFQTGVRARERITSEFGHRCIHDGCAAPPLHTGEYARSSLLALAAHRRPRFCEVILSGTLTRRVQSSWQPFMAPRAPSANHEEPNALWSIGRIPLLRLRADS